MKQNGYVFDPDLPAELARLSEQDRAMTEAMGGPFAGNMTLPEPLNNILDLGCGPGGWVLDVAFAFPHAQVAGVDISRPMVNFANARAQSQKRTNASFEVMDITLPLEFADGAFDLVNARYLVSVLKGRQWTDVLGEGFRLLRSGGMIRLVETDGYVVSTSPSLARLQKRLLLSLYERGYGFSADGGRTLGITPVLPHLIREAGFHAIHLTPFLFNGSQPNGAWVACLHLCECTYHLALQHGLLDLLERTEGETVPLLIDRMVAEIQHSTFGCFSYGVMVQAIKP